MLAMNVEGIDSKKNAGHPWIKLQRDRAKAKHKVHYKPVHKGEKHDGNDSQWMESGYRK
jgi:hypothetical protein